MKAISEVRSYLSHMSAHIAQAQEWLQIADKLTKEGNISTKELQLWIGQHQKDGPCICGNPACKAVHPVVDVTDLLTFIGANA